MAEILREDVMNGEISDKRKVKTLQNNLRDALLVRDPCATVVWVDAGQHWLAWHSDSLK